MSAKHTPVNWEIVPPEGSSKLVHLVPIDRDNGLMQIAGVYALRDAQDIISIRAINDELVAALERVIEVWEGPRERAAIDFAIAINVARAALAKVRP